MIIPCKDIAATIETSLKTEVQELQAKGIQPKLVTFLLDQTPEQHSFVAKKEKVGEQLGASFELINPQQVPQLEDLKKIVLEKATDPKTSGIIIQLPLPKEIPANELYKLIPSQKEIEGHVTSSHFQFPLSLAVLTGIKYVFTLLKRHPEFVSGSIEIPDQVRNDDVINQSLIVNFEKDKTFFQQALKDKTIVIAGRGITGGKPIAKAFDAIGIRYQLTHSETENADEIYKKADIIITATGKKIIHKNNIKKGVILLNVGLRKENEMLRGDYDEEEIKDIASFYTETPGGLGPLDVLYLYKNVIDAAKLNYSSF